MHGPAHPSASTAHPRSRGENYTRARRTLPTGGSSPLTRGKLPGVFHLIAVAGLIPAHAGKTASPPSKWPPNAAHPRSRGENSVAAVEMATQRGSSPLTRGKPDNHGDQGRECGLIPAHAGKTSASGSDPPLPRAHPRSRGENTAELTPLERDDGSSPLTRGKRIHRRQGRRTRRLIPAHAGKTTDLQRLASCPRAHPRSRGEN